MALHSRKPSPKRSRTVSRKIDEATLGAHHVSRRASAQARRRSPEASGTLSSSRTKTPTAYVEGVSPSTTSAETVADHSRRMRSGDYVDQTRRSRKRRRRVTAIVVVVVIVALAVGVGAFTYFTTMNANLTLEDASVDEALVAVDEGPQFVLCAAELGTAKSDDDPAGDGYELVRIDADARQLTFLDIPSGIVVVTKDNESVPLAEVRATRGNGALVTAIAEFAGVDISEFITTDAAGIRAMTDAAGGVSFDVTEMIDDPRASTIVLDAGEAKLDGDDALLVLRARNFQKPFEQRSYNRCAFTMQLLNQLLTLHGDAQAIADVSPSITGSVDTSELLAVADSLGDLTQLTVYNGVVPGQESSDTGHYNVSTAAWQAMIEAVKAGRAPGDTVPVASSVDPATLTIDVRNGGGITGAAASVADILEGQGYKVLSVDNMDDGATYTETFVIYRDSAYEGAATLVQSQIGTGRVIDGGDYYSFGTNLLVVVGQDYVVPA